MRNLKRALSLTLASVMLLGMMVVGSSAAAGYDDVKETDNVEAIEVLQAVEVMVGDDRGFGPDRPVNRAEMAVVMGKLLNLDYNYYVSTCPFTDVSGNYDWAKGWVGACAANGIVSGRGNGVYDPGATVTAVEAASMMMRALGYFKYTEDYADGFNVVTVRQGSQIGIFNGVGTDANTPMTRNQVAQMALNALESEMVTFTGTPGINANGVSVGYRAEYTPRTSTQTKYQAIERRTSDVSGGNNLNRGQYYIQLGEELYDGKLTKKYDTDDFERPSINWQYNGKEIGVYVDYDLLVSGGTFTTPVKYSELYNLLTFTTINDNDLYRYVDGVDQKETKDRFSRSNKDEVGGQGVLTEVFYNQDREEIVITSINTYLAKANSDYNSTNETLSLKVFETNGTGATKIVDIDDVDEAADVKKDEFRLVYMSGKDNAANKLEVVRIFDVETKTDAQITKWSKHDTKVVDKLTTEGTEYKTNPKAYYDKEGDVLLAYNEQRLTDTSYNIFMDRYDNVIGVDLYEGTKNYVFITGYDRINSNISVKTADAAAIFMDGTMEVITVNVTDTDKNIRNAKDNAANYVEWSHYSREGCRDLNRWYTYTTAANGNYTLKPVERSFYTSYDSVSDFDTKGVKVLNTANLYLNDARPTNGTVYTNQGRIYGNDDSVYITVEPGYVDTSTPTASHDAITDVQGVYTGAQDVKLEISTTSKELVNERKGASHATSVYPDDSVDYSKVDYGEVNNPSEQNAYVYSVYDSNYYIIAAVVLGDAQGATANYAYILGDAKSEWVEHGDKDDTYYWEFEAVLNGEKQTLTVKSKYEDTIDDLRKYHVQELRFDGEYVTAIRDVDPAKVMLTNNDTSLKTDDFDVYDVGHTTARVATDAWANSQNIHTDANGTVHNGRYEYDFSDHRIDGTIELVGRTLYTERPHDVGLALTSDAKAVLIQKENKSVETTQCDSVAEAIGRLADADTRDVPAADGIQFHGRIVAVLDSAGAAKWVVIISDTLLLTGNQPSYGNDDRIWMELIEGTATEGHYWKLHVPYSEDIYSTRPSSDEIAGWLEDAGCTEVSKDRVGWNFVRRGVTHTNQAVEVVWCGKDHFHEEDTYSVTVSPAAAGEVDARSYKAGDIVTVTAKPGENQVVKSVITNNDDPVNKVNETTYTFRMPAKNVIVYVTFETKEPEEELGEEITSGNITFAATDTEVNGGVNGPALRYMLSSKGQTLTTIHQGEEFVLVYSKAMTVEDGAEKTKKTVTIGTATVPVWKVDDNATAITLTENTGWNFFIGMWVNGLWEEDVPVKAVSARSMARAMAAGWMDDVRTNGTEYVGTFKVTINGTESTIVMNIGRNEATGGIKFTPDLKTMPQGATTRDVILAINKIASDMDKVDISKKPTEPSKDPKADPIQATVTLANGKYSAAFSAYFGTETTKKLNAKEIADALAAAEFTDAKVNLLEGTATAIDKNGDRETITFTDTCDVTGLTVTTELYKVSYPGGTLYLTGSSQKMTGIDEGVEYLILDTKISDSATQIPVDKKKHEAAISGSVGADQTYVAAIKASANSNVATGVVSVSAKPVLDAMLSVPGTRLAEKLDLTSDTYIRTDAEITLAKAKTIDASIVEGTTINIVVNYGIPKEVVVGESVTIKEVTIPVNEVSEKTGADKGTFVLSVTTTAAPAAETVVKINGTTVTKDAATGKWTFYDVPDGVTIVCENKYGKLTNPADAGSKLDGTYVKGGKYDYTFNAKDVYDSADTSKNEVHLVYAYKVQDNGDWLLYTDQDCTVRATSAVDDTLLIKADTPADKRTFYAEATDKTCQFAWKTTYSTEGIEGISGAAVSPTEIAKDNVWKFTVEKNITSGEFVSAVEARTITKCTISMASDTAEGDGIAVGETIANLDLYDLGITVNNKNVTMTGTLTATDGSGRTYEVMPKTGSAGIFSITLTGGEKLTTIGDFGTLHVKLSTGWEFDVVVALSA